jgi:tetratricopeptide (TPR) repeat protein/V8-like Glu-specific endopeptidase
MKCYGSWVPYLIVAGIALVSIQPKVMAKSSIEVNRIARAITVRVDGGSEGGSGIVVQKEGNIYTVLTAAHVTFDKSSNQVISTTIVTPDDQEHQIISSSVKRFSVNVDLAIVKFRSFNQYQVAELGDSNKIEGGMEVYVSGFPAPTKVITQRIMVFRHGQVTANSTKIFENGYSILYENSTLPGMSGGPVLNEQGQLVAVHGRGDRDPIDGGKNGFNAGIPIARFVDFARKADINLGINLASTTQDLVPRADDFLISATEKWRKDDYQGALTDVNKAIALNPSLAAAYSRRGTVKYALKDVEGALTDYNKAIKLNPKFARAYTGRGIVRADSLKDVPGALNDFNTALNIDPQYALAYNNRGKLKAYELNNISGALADYNKAIELNPQYTVAYQNRGNLKVEKLNDISGAFADYTKGIELDPRYAGAYIGRGNLKADRLNDISGALTDYNKAIELDPKLAAAYQSRGILKVNRLNDVSGALADYNKSIELDPQSAGVYISRGNLKVSRLNDVSGALADYNKSIGLDPQIAVAYQNRGLLKKYHLNDMSGAVFDFRKAAQLFRKQGKTQELKQIIELLGKLGATEN